MEANKKIGVFVMGFMVFVVVELGILGSANVVFQVHHKFSGDKRSLTAFKAHDSHRHRRILAAVDIPLGGDGSPTSSALYYTKLKIGNPPKDYYVQVDTGSDLLWVNCVGCDNCPRKSDLGILLALYDPAASSSASIISCDQDICKSAFDVSNNECTVGSSCLYSVKYGDGSSTSGYFVRDHVQLDRVSGNLQTATMNGSVAFGCGAKQSGGLGSSQQALDGILGFGQANSSMISQLAASNKVKRTFSHCLDGSKGGGIFAIGEVVKPKVATTPMVPEQAHYNVNLKAIEVKGDFLQFSTDVFDNGDNQGTIVDSGTTLAYFPDEVYNQLMEKILAAQPSIKIHIVDNQFKCFKYEQNVDDDFPVVTFHFEGSMTLKVHPHQYLFEDEYQDYCVGFLSNGGQLKDGRDTILLGDLVLTDKLVIYDMVNQTIGWTEYNCSSSITVRDNESGNVYEVGSHDISSAGRIRSDGIFLAMLLFLISALIK